MMATEAKTDVTSAVYTEQVRSLFRQIPTALSVNLVNAALVAIVLTPLATRPLVLPWFISAMLVTIGRGILWLRYRYALIQPESTRRWARLATWGSLAAGLSWGIGGIILFPVIQALGQLFLIIVIWAACVRAPWRSVRRICRHSSHSFWRQAYQWLCAFARKGRPQTACSQR
jgi:hypothetical protein